MRIRNNIPGMRGSRCGKELNNKTSKTLEKLSSGYRINRAGDDAAGLSVSERLRVNLTGYERCGDNVREGLDLARTADAALQEVNDMLCRAKELCVRAGNGTYTEAEREQLLDELNALCDEMDRIFESSNFNGTQLFRHVDGDYSNGTFEYIEEVIETPDPQIWGAMGQISRDFELTEPAKGSSLTLEMDSDVKTAADLKGKSFTVKSNGAAFVVSFGDGVSSGSSYSWDLAIGVDDCQTVQDAFDKLCEATGKSDYWNKYYAVMDSAEANTNTGEVVINFKPVDWTAPLDNVVDASGVEVKSWEVEGGNGVLTNNISIVSVQDEILRPVGADASFTVSAEFKLMPERAGSDLLTDAEKRNLRNNTLYVANTGIYFRSAESGDRIIDLDTITTVGELRAAVAEKAGTITNVSVAMAADGTMTVENSDYRYGSYIYESLSNGEESENVSVGALSGMNVSVLRPAGKEQAEITVISLPASFPPDPFSITVGGSTYCFYDDDDLKSGYRASSSHYNITGKTYEEVVEKIRSIVSGGYSSDATVTVNGNQIVVTAKAANKELGVSVESMDTEMYTYYQSDRVLLNEEKNSYNRYYQGYSLDLDVGAAMGGDEANVDALDGTGFKLNGNWYQFTTDSDPAVFTDQSSNRDAVPIDISGCDTYQEIADLLALKIAGSTVSVSGGVMNVSGIYENTSTSALNFRNGYTDGQDGLFNEDMGTSRTETASGGTNVTNPGTTIDFSKYDFRELYGKGFRVTCATCEDEYINVIFCYDKDQASFPPSFDETNANGETVTIHNMVVELKNMRDGSDIVRSIVTQLSGKLDHYTGIAVGNPASVLEVFDKRPGDIVDENQNVLRAKVESGVRTNCIYNVQENFYAAPDDIVGDIEIDYRNMNIFANADGGEAYIRIHLPYLTLENLKLNPPEPDFSTPEKALETMERVIQANNAISSMRGRLGADYNRLEHAYESLAQAEIQAADAYSRIRDTDMAEMMTEQVKLSILQSSQQAAQAHAIRMPQQILQLLE